MRDCYPEAIRRVLLSEGGYVNHPSDPGGETNYGITVAVARANGYSGSMRELPISEARRIYKLRYADPVRFDDDPAGLDYTLFDYAVNSGVSRAGKVIRRVCGLADDASWTDVFTALDKRDRKTVIQAVNDERIKFLMGLKTWPVFGKGWSARVRSVKSASMKMAEVNAMPVPASLPKPEPSVGKGEVPKPNITKPIATGGTIGGSAGTVTWWDWISAHPFVSAAIGIAALVAIILIAEYIARRIQRTKQDAPTPGLIPVPEIKKA